MKLREYFGIILKSLNPNSHRELAEMPFFDLVKYFFFLFLIGVLASVVVMVPMLPQYESGLNSELSEFSSFSIDVNASLKKPITLLERPEIRVDFGKENMTDEFVLVTNESVFYNKFIFFGEEKATFEDYQSIKSEKSAELYSNVLIFLFPSIVFWGNALFFVKHVALIFLFGILGWVFFISGKNEVSFQRSMKTAVFTATPMVLVDLVLWPITVMYVIPLAIYVGYFLIGLIMVSERRYESKKEE